MSAQNAIEIRNVSKTFHIVEKGYAGIKGQLGMLLKGIKPKVTIVGALTDISLDVAQGETLAVIGRNGSGKSLSKPIRSISRSSFSNCISRAGASAQRSRLGYGNRP